MKQSELYDAEVKVASGRGWFTYKMRPTLTVGRARAILESARDKVGDIPWKRNPNLTEKDLYKVLAPVVEGKLDHELVHHLAARNIVRVLGRFYKPTQPVIAKESDNALRNHQPERPVHD